jgi:Holliday junction DNA helicase RuvA
MISFIEGKVEQTAPLEVILNCQGVGYRIEVPITTAEKIPSPGQSIRLHVHPVYREDSQALYGFITREERDFFQLVTSRVSGIGPKIGLNLMSRLSFQMLREAIGRGDVALLSKCPGIGKKTAERVCIELKDKMGIGPSTAAAPARPDPEPAAESDQPAVNAHQAFADAVQALMTLGYKVDAADKAVRRASQTAGPTASADTLIKAALKGG